MSNKKVAIIVLVTIAVTWYVRGKLLTATPANNPANEETAKEETAEEE